MDIVLKESSFPARFRFAKPMTAEEFLRFCARNSDLRIEREPDGDILIMALVGSMGGSIELEGFPIETVGW